MKTIILLLCLLLTASCTSPAPVPPTPPSPPVPVVVHHYIIKEFDPNGVILRVWITDNYKEKSFPRSVTFMADGQSTTLTGSYQISRTD